MRMVCTFIERLEKIDLTKISEGPNLEIPIIGFDIETYSPNGFPAQRQDPIVAATLALSLSLNSNHGLMLISMIFPPSMEGDLLNILHTILQPCQGGSMVTYNGKRFDLLYTVHRGLLHGLNLQQTFENYGQLDIYEIVKSALPTLPGYGQKVVENFLGIKRLVKDVWGGNYHQAFDSFLKTGDPKPIIYRR
jgi:uncharacterized protein YprB with RNaseH-like and TPR domain